MKDGSVVGSSDNAQWSQYQQQQWPYSYNAQVTRNTVYANIVMM